VAVDDRWGHRVRDAGWRTAVTGGVLVWLAVLVPAIAAARR
jgi:hypothetical protein